MEGVGQGSVENVSSHLHQLSRELETSRHCQVRLDQGVEPRHRHRGQRSYYTKINKYLLRDLKNSNFEEVCDCVPPVSVAAFNFFLLSSAAEQMPLTEVNGQMSGSHQPQGKESNLR